MDNSALLRLAVETAVSKAIGSDVQIESEEFRDSIKSLYKLLKELNEEDAE